MRNLDECRLEVFRRSQDRIIRKIKRKRMLAYCVSLMLCVAVLAVVVFPWGQGATVGGGKPQELGTVIGGFESVQICHGTVCEQITDPVKVQEAYDQVRGLFASDGSNESYGPVNSPLLPPSSGQKPESGYTIVFAGLGCRTESYTLTGSELYSSQTGQTVELTDAQLRQLKTALGLLEQ